MQLLHQIGRRIILILATAIAGCAAPGGGLISSLEDLSTESVKEGMVKIPQYRVASIPGWLPFADVGGLYFYKPSRKPASVIGLSPDAESFVLVSEIDGKCADVDLAAIRDRIVHLGTLGSDLVQERVGLLGQQAQKARTDAPALATADENYRKARTAFNEAYEDVVKSLKANGILIYRWAVDSQQNASAGADTLASASGQKKQALNGFALVCGIRTKTLFVGNRLLQGWKALDTRSRFSNRFEMTTHIMQARSIMYGAIADLDSYAQAHLQASAKQLAALPEELRSLAQIEIGLTLSKVSNLSNMGVMGNISRKIVPVAWDANDLRQRLAQDDWLTFFSVESDFTDLLELLEQAKPAR